MLTVARTLTTMKSVSVRLRAVLREKSWENLKFWQNQYNATTHELIIIFYTSWILAKNCYNSGYLDFIRLRKNFNTPQKFLELLLILLENPKWRAPKLLSPRSARSYRSPLRSLPASSRVSKTFLFISINIVSAIKVEANPVRSNFFVSQKWAT